MAGQCLEAAQESRQWSLSLIHSTWREGWRGVRRVAEPECVTNGATKSMGYKTDLLWRMLDSSGRAWAVAEAASGYDPITNKYRFEVMFKLSPHMHNISSTRAAEVGRPGPIRNDFVSV